MKNKLALINGGFRSRARGVKTALVTTVLATGAAMAQTGGSGNAGADSIITEIEGLVPVAVAVIGAAVLVVIVPWGAKMAIRAFKSIGG